MEGTIRMSKNTLYYGQIVARIAGRLYSINHHSNDNSWLNDHGMSMEDVICDVCADAGRVFDCLEDLSGEHFIDWSQALDHYSRTLLKSMTDGRIPCMADMISMAANSMDHSRADD
ncbi:hypothetical protein OB69_04045 [Roseivirga seohaensis subsp. aquiponti]|uniref:Uncharacterized protein n=1 Tax=Roseivirga seohaensis subsp. aquiponti TaxID=1566026 RepID=A0A0L8AP98_9BACT|nr:hypothetical protein OB69_04045 [Roseivirga seohaensis subsp. aquiponti]